MNVCSLMRRIAFSLRLASFSAFLPMFTPRQNKLSAITDHAPDFRIQHNGIVPALNFLPPYRVRKPSLPPRDGCAVTEAQLAAPVVYYSVACVELHFSILLALPIQALPRRALPYPAKPGHRSELEPLPAPSIALPCQTLPCLATPGLASPHHCRFSSGKTTVRSKEFPCSYGSLASQVRASPRPAQQGHA